ncbi:hypothetical protein GQ457_08G019160 [Hibiscus cannabinus]
MKKEKKRKEMRKDKGERENGEKWRGWGFASICGHRRGGGVHLHHHCVHLVETSQLVVSKSPSELALEGVKKMKVRVVRVNNVRVFEMENGGHHRNQRSKNSGMGARRHRPTIGSRHTRRTLWRLRVGLCRSQLGAHKLLCTSATLDQHPQVHHSCCALRRTGSASTLDHL